MIPRSWLFVPGDSERKLAKSLESGADAVIVDLEDAVLPANKAAARRRVADFLAAQRGGTTPSLWVRTNAVASGLLADDLAVVFPSAPAGIVLPKPASVDDVRYLNDLLSVLEREHGVPQGLTRILAIATETAVAVTNLPGYVHAPPRLLALNWGGEDLSAELGAITNRDADGAFRFTYRLVRSLCQLAAAAAGVAAIETLAASFRDEALVTRMARCACEDGFSGMLAVHPAQVPVINAAFTPDAKQLAAARSIVEAFDRQPDAGTVQLDGRMLDRPHLVQAQRLLARGRLA